MIIFTEEQDDIFLIPPINPSDDKPIDNQIEYLHAYIKNLSTELHKLRQITIDNQAMYNDLINITEKINEIQLNLNKDERDIQQDTEYIEQQSKDNFEINQMLQSYNRIYDQIMNLQNNEDSNIKELSSLINIEIEKFNNKLLENNAELKKQNNDLKQQLQLYQYKLEQKHKNIDKITNISNNILNHIIKIATYIETLESAEKTHNNQETYYTERLAILVNNINGQLNQIDELINIIKGKDEQIYQLNHNIQSMNKDMEYYENINLKYTEKDNTMDELMSYLVKIYKKIYKAEKDIIKYINMNNVSNVSKTNIINLIKLIKEDQYMRNVNMAIISYINKTQELKQQLFLLKSNNNVQKITNLLNQYIDDMNKLNLKGSSMENNISLINKYLGQISHKKYNNTNLENDTINLHNAINATYADDIQLDIEYIKITPTHHETPDLMLQKQMNSLLNLIIYFKILDCVQDRQTFEDNLDKYNFYIKLSESISQYKYDKYDHVPNNEKIGNIKGRTIRHIREYINIIGKNSNEHSDLTNLGIKFKEISGEMPNINIDKVYIKIQEIEIIIYKKFKKLDPYLLSIFKKANHQEIKVIIELFENQV